MGILHWEELLQWVKALPYGRNQQRNNPLLVLLEKKGTCSTKHALLKMYAEENELHEYQLVVGIYRMNENNTPQASNILKENGLTYLPEAHCYLKSGSRRIDATLPGFDIASFEEDILEEMVINIEQIADFKVNMHKHFLKDWIKKNEIVLDFEKVWSIREACITALNQ